ncbi:DUF3365 domain-containing protein [Cereibacter sphaeroides]|uniref:Tll0287-like domain-containing protein n=1 Tax=Cereibacter sphaeroides TaxID=1063 RepID=UPI001F46319C|nr:DUF3365 domain-containing protein [Cereibacter sphaeroides]MCE6959153.1 DUF3365 domain-containing protein [Cereibacter sphaeroides]MCE6968394.1 DUF3365 domain-containing protein [Cereibacter sphaeroides]MCE6974186.1 DUF3365 domain-containing protein [Cereibacter sphaeroides]
MQAFRTMIGRCGWALLVTVAPLAPPALAEATPEVAQAREATKQLQQTLQQALKDAMATGGPQGAVEACNLQALPLTAQISQDLGVEISRTALRTRNPANTPDAWEEEQLRRFEERLKAGEPAASLEVVREDDAGIHYMKAIPMQEPCATCHGTEVDPALQDRIRALYPQDAATGFRVGELRGAFTVTIPRK